MASLRWTSSLLAGLLLAGCASKPAPIQLRPPPEAPSGIEGLYRGTARLIRADNRFCPRSGPRTYQLRNGVVTLSYQGAGRARVSLSAPIDGNGEFDTSDGEGRLQGRAVNGSLIITIGSQYCEHHWTMRLID